MFACPFFLTFVPITVVDPVFHFTVCYPELPSKYNQVIGSFIEEQVRKYCSSYTEKQQLWIRYTPYVSSLSLSFLFQKSIDYGGAHPMHSLYTFSITDSGLFSVLDFSFGELSLISQIVQKGLKEELQASSMYVEWMFLEGTAPTYENYRNVLLLEDGYLFFFEPYQVAPYASGIQSYFVPYDFYDL